MKRFAFCMICFLAAVMYSSAQQNPKYLAGAVPEKDGRVYFSKTLKATQLSKDEIYKAVSDWCKLRFAETDGFRRKVLTADSIQGELIALGDDYLVFQNTVLSLDRAHLLYNFTLSCRDGACEVNIFRLTYRYKVSTSDVPERYTAEEMINDANAIKKGKLVRSSSKFRIKTVDYVEGLYAEIEDLLGKETLKKVNK
mgnify:CR=1 FL=1